MNKPSPAAQVERGELVPTDVTIADRLATLLGAPLNEFVQTAPGPRTDRPRQRPHAEQLRPALAGHPVPDTITATATTRSRCDRYKPISAHAITTLPVSEQVRNILHTIAELARAPGRTIMLSWLHRLGTLGH